MRETTSFSGTTANIWMRVRTNKIRHTKIGIFFRPSNAEMRRWLKDPSTPTGVKNKIYAWLRYRQENAQ